MYNTESLNFWKESTQKKVDMLIIKESKKLNRIIKKELRKGDVLINGMGMISISDKNNKSYEFDGLRKSHLVEPFRRELEQMLFGLKSVPIIEDFNNIKNEK